MFELIIVALILFNMVAIVSIHIYHPILSANFIFELTFTLFPRKMILRNEYNVRVAPD